MHFFISSQCFWMALMLQNLKLGGNLEFSWYSCNILRYCPNRCIVWFFIPENCPEIKIKRQLLSPWGTSEIHGPFLGSPGFVPMHRMNPLSKALLFTTLDSVNPVLYPSIEQFWERSFSLSSGPKAVLFHLAIFLLEALLPVHHHNSFSQPIIKWKKKYHPHWRASGI
jgi:hypothetical protein